MVKSAPINMRVEAENVLLDRCLFQLDPDAFAAFETALDKSMPDNDNLKALLSEI